MLSYGEFVTARQLLGRRGGVLEIIVHFLVLVYYMLYKGQVGRPDASLQVLARADLAVD